MSLRLIQRVEQVRTAARRLVWQYALSWFALAAVAIAAGMGLVDFLLRPHDPVLRWSLSATALVLLAIGFIKLAWPALAFRQSLVGAARRIELHFPQLGERLSSAIAFLSADQDDATAGSPELRRTVVAQAEALSADLDFKQALDRRLPRRALRLAVSAFALASVLVLLNPVAAGLAVARIGQPWRAVSWPRRHELAVVNPRERVAKGDNVEIAVQDRRGSLPDDVEIILRQETPAGRRIQARAMKTLDEKAVYRIDNVTHDFEYRVRGGDDDTMPWTAISVVEPPKILKLEVLVQPPAYTGLAARSEGRLVKALIGSQLRLTGTLDQPIRSAVISTPTQDLPLPSIRVSAD